MGLDKNSIDTRYPSKKIIFHPATVLVSYMGHGTKINLTLPLFEKYIFVSDYNTTVVYTVAT